MIGQKVFTISAKDFLKGASTAADTNDGGFSPQTDAVNLIAQPGIVNAPAQPTDNSTNVSGSFIASCEDYQNLFPLNRFFVDGSGNHYSFNGTTVTKQVTGAKTYTDGKTDLVAFNGGFYSTSTTDIGQWNGTGTLTENYWTSTLAKTALNANVPHPMLVFQKNLYIGDGNLLHMIDTSAAGHYGWVTLVTNDVIVTLGIDPSSGMMLISTTTGQNISDTRATTNKVHVYDGVDNKPQKTVQVEDMVSAFRPHDGVVHVFYGLNFGYWTGAGLKFIRKLANNALSNVPAGSTGGLVWKHRVTSIDNTLYYVDGNRVWAYGPVEQGGRKIFYPAYKNNDNSNAFSLISNVGGSTSKLLGLSFATSTFKTWDPASIATNNTMSFVTQNYDFEGPVWVRQIWILRKNALANNNDPGSISLQDEQGNSVSYDLQNTTGTAEYLRKIERVNQKVRIAQLTLSDSNIVSGIREITVRFDPAELRG